LKSLKISDREIRMAERLIGEMTDHWKPEQYHDEYRDELLAFIKKRGREGKLASAPETETEMPARSKGGEVIDLAELLQKSLGKAGPSKREERRSPRSKKTA
jgi:DNA end-binding protein Ku